MRIWISGATGYLGGVLSRHLKEAGHEVVALVRQDSRLERLQAMGVECAFGDVTDRYSLRAGMSGADWVVHAAAELDPWAPPDRMHRVNVEGAENVASLAWKLGVGRVLAISSVANWGGSPPSGEPATEQSPLSLPLPTPYCETKHEAQLVFSRWAKEGLRVHTLYPSLVYGPPGKVGGANQLLATIAAGRLPIVVGGDRWTSWLYVDDFVNAALAVIDREPGERDLILAGEGILVSDLVEKVSRMAGRRAPRLKMPLALLRSGMALVGPALAVFGRRPPLPRSEMRNLARHWRFDDSLARTVLTWQPRGLALGLPPTLEMFARPATP